MLPIYSHNGYDAIVGTRSRIQWRCGLPDLMDPRLTKLMQGPLEMTEFCYTELRSPLDHLKIALTLERDKTRTCDLRLHHIAID